MSKVGIALITCDRLNFFKTCLSSILNVTDTFDTLVVVNDGVLDVDNQLLTDVNVYINHEENQGVGPSKNGAMRSPPDQGCEHLFFITTSDKNHIFGAQHTDRYHQLSLWSCHLRHNGRQTTVAIAPHTRVDCILSALSSQIQTPAHTLATAWSTPPQGADGDNFAR